MKIPCKKCISFAICINRIKEWLDPADFTHYALLMDCDELTNYRLYIEQLQKEELKLKVNEVRSLFRLPTLPRSFGAPYYCAVRINKPNSQRIEYFSHTDCTAFTNSIGRT